MTSLTAISSAIIVDQQIPLDVVWIYSEHQPLEVCMTWSIQRGENVKCCPLAPHPTMRHRPIRWVFARDLLDEALQTPGKIIGLGDVNLRASANNLTLWVTANDGEKHEVITEIGPVCDFMLRSYVMVPANREPIDVDNAIQKIFGAAS